jgi:hypothetical protein
MLDRKMPEIMRAKWEQWSREKLYILWRYWVRTCLCLCLKTLRTFVVVFFSLRDLPIVKLQSTIIWDVKIPLVTDSIINIFIDGADNIFI